jgi:uncharacterized protein YeaO (DUF488 family)
MALFARILWRGAVDSGSQIQFISLVELVKKKGGIPICFVLGRHTMSCDESEKKGKNEMIRIKAKLIGKYITRFWPHGIKEGSVFFDCESDLWQKTTSWLYAVVVESWYVSSQERYVKVGRSRQRKKKLLRTEEEQKQADLIQEARVREALYLCELKNELSNLRLRLESLEAYDVVPGHVFVKKENSEEYGFICRKVEKISRAITHATWERSETDSEFLKPIPRIRGSLRLISSSR